MTHRRHCRIDCLIAVLEGLCDCGDGPDEGSITLNQGWHEITIRTDVPPKAVFLSVQPEVPTVCGGSVDLAGYRLLADGFVIYADIKCAMAEVRYRIES